MSAIIALLSYLLFAGIVLAIAFLIHARGYMSGFQDGRDEAEKTATRRHAGAFWSRS